MLYAKVSWGERVWWQSCWQFKSWLRHKINTLFLMVKLDGAVMDSFCLPGVFLAPSLSSDLWHSYLHADVSKHSLKVSGSECTLIATWAACVLAELHIQIPLKSIYMSFGRCIRPSADGTYWVSSVLGHSTVHTSAFRLLWPVKESPGGWHGLFTQLETVSLKFTGVNIQIIEVKLKATPETARQWQPASGYAGNITFLFVSPILSHFHACFSCCPLFLLFPL